MRSPRSILAVPAAFLAAVVAACAGAGPSGSPSQAPAAVAGPPEVVIQSPPGNAQVVAGQAVDVVTTAVDGVGVGRIDLLADGSTLSSAEAPAGGLPTFSAVHLWVPAAEGTVTLAAVAYRIDGAPSAPMSITVLILPQGSEPAPYPTFQGAVPTYRAAAVPPDYAPPTYKANATSKADPTYAAANPTDAAGATPTYQAQATPTYEAEATPTYEAVATPTYVAEATPTNAVATPTAAPIAPADNNYTFKVPFNGANELSDEVSYPAGDVQDIVSYSVTGMSQTPPQHLANLIVFATCDGLGTEYITFQVGTAKFGCGTQIITRQVTADSNTGQIKVFAFAGAYVRWTLSASAFAP